MAEQMRIEIPYTYTYDQFTVFFHDERVFVAGKAYPLGQCCVDFLEMDRSLLDELERRVQAFVPAAQNLLVEKSESAAVLAQEKLNAVWEIIFALPVYRDLNMDDPCNYDTFRRLMADPEKWAQVQDPTSEGYGFYQKMITNLARFPDDLRSLWMQLHTVLQTYFERLKWRNKDVYARAYSYYYMDMNYVNAHLLQDTFTQAFPMEVSFVPMMSEHDENEVFIAEKVTFYHLAHFLLTEFYRALAVGNAPRRCHNCGKYFLLTTGYNTCYCNNIAPGETERTCRKVGAHRKEAQGKANRTPAQREYDRTYNRLKGRKQRKKISVDEWNAAVAKAQELLAQSERGTLTDEELKQRLSEL